MPVAGILLSWTGEVRVYCERIVRLAVFLNLNLTAAIAVVVISIQGSLFLMLVAWINDPEGDFMENRWSDRRELRLDVDVFRNGEKICSCQSRDVGLGGAFLDMQQAHSMGQDDSVELVFHLLSGQAPIKHSLRARVVRIAKDGVGLKFHEFDTSVFRSLQEIMSYKGSDQVH